MKKRNSYTKEFKKRVALEAIRGDKTLAQISSEFDVHVNQIRDWKAQALDSITDGFVSKRGRKAGKEQPVENQLFEQIGRLKMENEFLKKKYNQLLDI